MPDYALIRERLRRRPGCKAFEPGTREIYFIDPLTGALGSETAEPPTFSERIRTVEEIRATRVVEEKK